MKPEPIYAAVESVLGIPGEGKAGAKRIGVPVILLSPQGRLFSQEIARTLARRERVLESAAREITQATGTDVLAVPADVTRPGQIQGLFDKTMDAHGRVDILVNNAGTGITGHFQDISDETWQADLDLKLFAAIRCSRTAIPIMQAQGGGRIINVTNVDAKAPGPRSAPASVSRAAGIALTKAMSKDYARDNILINTVCIGFIKSAQNDRHWERGRSGTSDLTLEEWYAEMGKTVPLGRIGEAKEAGDVIAFLASERASYISGSAINIDGGAGAVV